MRKLECSYLTPRNGGLIDLAAPQCAPSLEALEAHDEFVSMISSASYPCMMGAQAIAEGRYAFSLLDELGTDTAADANREALARFDAEFPASATTGGFASFIAIFESPTCLSEKAFEQLLWAHLQRIHDGDCVAWNADVSPDPADPKFSFSVGGRAFYVIGMHTAASRQARRFARPALIFNPHDQFESLRSARVFERIKAITRLRDRQLQGNNNPMLADHGSISEARQYSGRTVDANWRCPFHPRANSQEGAGEPKH